MEEQLLEYGISQFEQGQYDAALEAFILAYQKGYQPEFVLENIYNCYMAGNEAEFQKNFERWNTSEKPSYETLTLDFIPYCEGEYYIYDKEIQSFRGVFSMDVVRNASRVEELQPILFSALAVSINWNWQNLPEILAEAKFRKLYVVCEDINRCASFFKITELAEYAENIMLFSNAEEFQRYFHEHTSVYLPKLCVGIEEEKEKLLTIIKQEHAYRLTPEGRNTDNVLLTIGIPTYDRGNLILKRLENLRQMPYDAEIEFAISKNGTTLYQEEYRSIENIPDARIRYHGYDETLTAWKNTKNVMRIASGKFVLIVSDEDDVIIEALEHYLHVLRSNDDLGMVRAATTLQYRHVTETIHYKKGEDALFGGFLLNNYMSGIIYRRNMFWASGIEEWDKKYLEQNIFYKFYPHMWCQVLLSKLGDYQTDSVCLIAEGKPAYQDMKEQYQAKESPLADRFQWKRNIPLYSEWKNRIKQQKDAFVIFSDFAGEDIALKTRLFTCMIYKSIYLMEMVKNSYTMKERLEGINEFLDETNQALLPLETSLTEESEKGIVSRLAL